MKRNRRHCGQAMAEFAVIVMVLLLLILGALQFGLIYHAKNALNYAAFETARAGSVNNARMWAMELAFARSLAPLYTTPYRRSGATGPCVPPVSANLDAGIANLKNESTTLNVTLARGAQPIKLESVYCARAQVRQFLKDGYARILQINPSAGSFAAFGQPGGGGVRYIPNDNLMYRSRVVKTDQSIQDANLIKVHVGLCYELIVPIVDRLIAGFTAFSSTDPSAPFYEGDKPTIGNFGPPAADTFAKKCALDPYDKDPEKGRYGIPIYAHAVMRMQSEAIDDGVYCAGYCPGP